MTIYLRSNTDDPCLPHFTLNLFDPNDPDNQKQPAEKPGIWQTALVHSLEVELNETSSGFCAREGWEFVVVAWVVHKRECR
jgi:hypothetical protein